MTDPRSKHERLRDAQAAVINQLGELIQIAQLPETDQEAQVIAMRKAGTQMANTLYNWAQSPAMTNDREREICKGLIADWDQACRTRAT